MTYELNQYQIGYKAVHLLDAFPRYAVNTYLAGDVLVDSGTRRRHERILGLARRLQDDSYQVSQ